MTPAAFDYVRAESLAHAVELKGAYGVDASLLAGGQSLVPLLSMRLARPGVVIDIGHLAEEETITEDNGAITLGPLVRHRTLEREGRIGATLPVLRVAAQHVAYPSVRNFGTLGGAVALGDPAAEYPATLTALSARIHLASHRGAREVAAEDFFLGGMITAVADDEVVRGVSVVPMGANDQFGFYEVSDRKCDYALAGCAVIRRWGAHGRASTRVALFGVAEQPLLLEGAAAVLDEGGTERWSDDALTAAADVARDSVDRAGGSRVKAHWAGVALRRAAANLLAGADTR